MSPARRHAGELVRWRHARPDGLVPETDGFVWTIVVTIVWRDRAPVLASAFVSAAGYGDGVWLSRRGGMSAALRSALLVATSSRWGSAPAAADIRLRHSLRFQRSRSVALRRPVLHEPGNRPQTGRNLRRPAVIGFMAQNARQRSPRFFLDAPAALQPRYMGPPPAVTAVAFPAVGCWGFTVEPLRSLLQLSPPESRDLRHRPASPRDRQRCHLFGLEAWPRRSNRGDRRAGVVDEIRCAGPRDDADQFHSAAATALVDRPRDKPPDRASSRVSSALNA